MVIQGDNVSMYKGVITSGQHAGTIVGSGGSPTSSQKHISGYVQSSSYKSATTKEKQTDRLEKEKQSIKNKEMLSSGKYKEFQTSKQITKVAGKENLPISTKEDTSTFITPSYITKIKETPDDSYKMGVLSLADYLENPTEARKEEARILKSPIETGKTFVLGGVESIGEIPYIAGLLGEKIGLTQKYNEISSKTKDIKVQSGFTERYQKHIDPTQDKGASGYAFKEVDKVVKYSLGEKKGRKEITTELSITGGLGVITGGAGSLIASKLPSTIAVKGFSIAGTKALSIGTKTVGAGLLGVYGVSEYSTKTKEGLKPEQAIGSIAGDLLIKGAVFKTGVGIGKTAISPISKPIAQSNILKGKLTPKEYAERPFSYKSGEWGSKYNVRTEQNIKTPDYNTKAIRSFHEGRLKTQVQVLDKSGTKFYEGSIKQTQTGTKIGKFTKTGTFQTKVKPYQTLKTGTQTIKPYLDTKLSTRTGVKYTVSKPLEVKTISSKTGTTGRLDITSKGSKYTKYYSKTITPKGTTTADLSSSYKYKIGNLKLGEQTSSKVYTTGKSSFDYTDPKGLSLKGVSYISEKVPEGKLKFFKTSTGEKMIDFKPSTSYSLKTGLTSKVQSTSLYQGYKMAQPKVVSKLDTLRLNLGTTRFETPSHSKTVYISKVQPTTSFKNVDTTNVRSGNQLMKSLTKTDTKTSTSTTKSSFGRTRTVQIVEPQEYSFASLLSPKEITFVKQPQLQTNKYKTMLSTKQKGDIKITYSDKQDNYITQIEDVKTLNKLDVKSKTRLVIKTPETIIPKRKLEKDPEPKIPFNFNTTSSIGFPSVPILSGWGGKLGTTKSRKPKGHLLSFPDVEKNLKKRLGGLVK